MIADTAEATGTVRAFPLMAVAGRPRARPWSGRERGVGIRLLVVYYHTLNMMCRNKATMWDNRRVAPAPTVGSVPRVRALVSPQLAPPGTGAADDLSVQDP